MNLLKNNVYIGRKVYFQVTDPSDDYCFERKEYYTATACRVEKDKALFIFDQCLRYPLKMNDSPYNEGGYWQSDLRWKMHDILLDSLNSEFDGRVLSVSIPSIGEIFGHSEAYVSFFEEDRDEQLENIDDLTNIWSKNSETDIFWLRNRVNNMGNETDFAIFDIDTRNDQDGMSGFLKLLESNYYAKVRPEFWVLTRGGLKNV